jgi:hypothetical protein
MTQTTLIGGLGLAVFALSTFTPTQRFGVMMVTILAAALIGDLIFLPALLAGPLGRAFCPKSPMQPPPSEDGEGMLAAPVEETAATESAAMASLEDLGEVTTPHSSSKASRAGTIRRDRGHRWPQK